MSIDVLLFGLINSCPSDEYTDIVSLDSILDEQQTVIEHDQNIIVAASLLRFPVCRGCGIFPCACLQFGNNLWAA